MKMYYEIEKVKKIKKQTNKQTNKWQNNKTKIPAEQWVEFDY